MPRATRGEVWQVDLGYAAKVRPCLIVSIPPLDTDRALITIVPHTTSLRGSRFEVKAHARFLKPGAFDAQNVITVSDSKLLRRLGSLDAGEFQVVMEAVSRWLGLSP